MTQPTVKRLSLGDSLAFGFQRAKALAGLPPAAFDTGYANLVAARLEHGAHPLALVNYGCPGESTATFIAGPCPWTAAGLALHDAFTGSQQSAAANRARFADPFPIFNPDGDTGAALCTLTLLCNDGDAHPSDIGYRAIADLIQAQLGPELIPRT